ncbi:nucleolar complex protein 14 [Dissophora globulifera]|uniref:Nucleolar complex protein 14 n=1 Tax=Dissophora globulifera TaxID=979702 RepID=A0A9P6RJH9_9FUNG|nr:nucleolar complex protein 14 [Dissophora globulifera]
MAKSALYRLKSSLKEAGAIGPNSRASLSKKDRKKGRPTAASAKNDLSKKLAHIKDAMNPFEMKVTNQKYDVLGRKAKGVQGKPTLSKQVGEENRRKTLLQELQRKNKAGGVIDKRFGEDDPNMTPEDKMLERFTREKQSRAKGGAMFNLDEETDLTHYGQSLAGLDDFDETELGYSDDDGEENRGAISGDIVSHSHFGGFDEAPEETHEDGRPKSKAEVMKEVIAKSKFHKHERQKEKDEVDDITKELDDELEGIRGLLGFSDQAAEDRRPKRAPLPSQKSSASRALDRIADEEKERIKADRESGILDKDFDDSYDKHIRELAFDRRAKPQDRMKTEEELAQEEVEKLEKAERARKRRMEGLTVEEDEADKGGFKKRRKAVPAADDLDDDFAPDGNDEFGLGAGIDAKEDVFRGVKPGRMPSKKRRTVKVVDSESEGEGGAEDDEDEDDDEDNDDEGDEDEDDEDEDEDEDDEEDEGDADDFSDLDIEIEPRTNTNGISTANGDDDENDMNDMNDMTSSRPSKTAKVESKKAKVSIADAAAAAAELPYMFPCPTSLSHFQSIIADIAMDDIPTVVHRIRALYHPKLSPQNKEKMQIFYPVLLDYVFQISTTESKYPTAALNKLVRHIYAMTSQLGDFATVCVQGFLEAFESELVKELAAGTESGFPKADKLTFFRILGQIYSTSDFQHQVITPAQFLMSQYLGQCQVSSVKDLVSGLMLCNLFLDYQTLSKRAVPEAINFLSASLVYLAPKGTFEDVDSLPGQFPIFEINKPALQMLTKELQAVEVERLSMSMFKMKDAALDKNRYKVSVMSAAADLLTKYALLYSSTSAFKELFDGPIGLLQRLAAIPDFSPSLQQQLSKSLDRIQKLNTFSSDSRAPLQMQAHKPVPIASYVPKFEEGYSLDKHYDPDVERAQAHKLQVQYKKEKKGAIRELRKDAQFVAREKLKVQREKDAVYSSKIKGIMSGLEADQGEKNAESRIKKLQKMKGKRS